MNAEILIMMIMKMAVL